MVVAALPTGRRDVLDGRICEMVRRRARISRSVGECGRVCKREVGPASKMDGCDAGSGW